MKRRCGRQRECYPSPTHLISIIQIQTTHSEGFVSETMGKTTKKELLASAPWRATGDDQRDKFKDAKLKVTAQPGSTPTMHVPGKRKPKNLAADEDDSLAEIDPELRYSFQRNFQFLQRVFSIDTIVKPLPYSMQYNVSRNLSFFTRIFTQFYDPQGIANAQKALGLGQEDKVRTVR
ncbi:hypothetical protein QVD17_26136 [Tagetes erecta]|uniref:Uncharacterized protein n=1 Tax=Tagetes erecta TaxID=13708 RepID=A0AAD8K6X4_TARER|nr:hypothetical protein QVD17_26136 [Tagetes erecta]